MAAIITVVLVAPQTQFISNPHGDFNSAVPLMRNSIGLLLGILLLASCSGGGDEGQGTSTSTAVPTTAASTTAGPTTAETTTSTTTAPTGQSVEVFFGVGDGSDCGRVQAFGRDSADSDDVYRATFQLLAAGPSEPEKSAGASSFFSAAVFRIRSFRPAAGGSDN